MKNVVIVILVAITVVVGYIAATSSLRMSIASRRGQTAVITRGDLTLPISATGEIKPARQVVVKSEASGAVIEIAKLPGERVAVGDRVIHLQPDDEQRNVNRAKLAVTTAKARLEDAKSALAQAEGPDLESAKANVRQIEATLILSKYRADRAKETPDAYTEEERLQRLSTYQRDLANLGVAQAAVKKAELAIPRAKEAVTRAEADYETAENNLGDAEKQLVKTDIVSPIDGIVAAMNTQIGEVIQSGKLNFGGGTALAVLLDMSKVILQAEVDEADIGRVSELAPDWAKPGHDSSLKMPDDVDVLSGMSGYVATVRVETFPEEEFRGVIERIHPQPVTVQNVTTYLVDVVIISDNKAKLLPGMRGEVKFTSEHVAGVVLCPNEAIRRGPGDEYGVYIPQPNAAPGEPPYEFQSCRIGITDGAMTEVREGLREGTTVYTKLPVAPQNNDDNSDRGRR